MPKSKGYRALTRHMYKRKFRKHGLPTPAAAMINFKVGDCVDILANSAIHNGMPHRHFHGRTGTVFDITPRSCGVLINKRVRHRTFIKKVHIRVEHLRQSKSLNNHLARVQANRIAREEAKKAGIKLDVSTLKRQPGQPAPGRFVKVTALNKPVTIAAEKFVHKY